MGGSAQGKSYIYFGCLVIVCSVFPSISEAAVIYSQLSDAATSTDATLAFYKIPAGTSAPNGVKFIDLIASSEAIGHAFDVTVICRAFSNYTGNCPELPDFAIRTDPVGVTMTPTLYHMQFTTGSTTPLDSSRYYAFGIRRWSGDAAGINLRGVTTTSSCVIAGCGLSGSPYVVLSDSELESPACTEDCFSNVLFLPGIESSRLYRPDYAGGTERLWEPGNSSDIRDLYMTDEGKSIRDDIYTKEGDVLDEITVTGANVYKSFMQMMDEMQTEGTINDWGASAYDWRLSLDDVLAYGNAIDDRIYYAGTLAPTSTPYIVQELRRLAAGSKSGKVTIVAHSNGGLVAKRLTQVLGAEASDLIDKMIFVAVPQEGTPIAIAAGLHGYDQAIGPGGLIASESDVRSFASTAPMFYQLLPSAGYFSHVSDPVVSFDESLPEWITRYGSSITTISGLHQFLTDSFGRVASASENTDQPIQLKSGLISAAESLHASLDAWQPPNGVELIQIAGWGVPTTVSGITYKKKGDSVQPEVNFTIDGDGTVVVPSALSTNNLKYWFDLKGYNNDHRVASVFGFLLFNHARILETEQLLSYVSDSITNTTFPISDYIYLSTSAPIADELRLRYSLHSPLTLDLYDNQGRHTGYSTTTGQIEEEIPGTYFAQFGDIKYLFTETSSPSRVILNGYDTGVFTLEVEELEGDTVVASTTWQDMPTTPQTEATLAIESDISTLSALKIDKNGDGAIDLELAPKLNDIVSVPKYPLTITADDKTMTLGGAPPSLTATITGFVDSETLATSDIEGAAECSVDSFSVGPHEITCAIGTMESKKYEFATFVPGILSVVYKWSGFTQPINDTAQYPNQTASIFKAGSTVPVKFQLKKSNGTPIQASSTPRWLAPQKGSSMNASIDESVYTASGTSGSSYRWDAASQQYIYNWSTKGLAAGYWYRIYAQLDDGKTYSVVVGLR